MDDEYYETRDEPAAPKPTHADATHSGSDSVATTHYAQDTARSTEVDRREIMRSNRPESRLEADRENASVDTLPGIVSPRYRQRDSHDIPSSPRTFSSPGVAIFSDEREYASPGRSSPAHLEEMAAGALQFHATRSETEQSHMRVVDDKHLFAFATDPVELSYSHTTSSRHALLPRIEELDGRVAELAPIQAQESRRECTAGHTLPPVTDITDRLPSMRSQTLPSLLHSCPPPHRAVDSAQMPLPSNNNGRMHPPAFQTNIFDTPHLSFTQGSSFPHPPPRRSTSLSLPSPHLKRPISTPHSITHRMSIPTITHTTYHCPNTYCTSPPFATPYLLSSHLKVHSVDRPHYCPVQGCKRSVEGGDGHGGVGFKRKNEMIRHGLVHKSPGYVCPWCRDGGRAYPRPDNLQRHVKAHHADKSKDDLELKLVLSQRSGEGSRGVRRVDD